MQALLFACRGQIAWFDNVGLGVCFVFAAWVVSGSKLMCTITKLWCVSSAVVVWWSLESTNAGCRVAPNPSQLTCFHIVVLVGVLWSSCFACIVTTLRNSKASAASCCGACSLPC